MTRWIDGRHGRGVEGEATGGGTLHTSVLEEGGTRKSRGLIGGTLARIALPKRSAMSHIRVLVCRVDDETPDHLTELAGFDLSEPHPAASGIGHNRRIHSSELSTRTANDKGE